MRVRGIRNLLDLPLVTEKQIHTGDVVDVLVDFTEQRAIKLGISWVMNDRQVSGPDLNLPFNQIVTFDPHQVVVSDEIAETAGLDLLNYEEDSLVSVSQALLDHEVVDEAGQSLGSLVDLFVDEEDGAILGFEITTERSESEHDRTRILAPSTDMELRDGRIVMPARIRTVTLLPAEGSNTLNDEDREEAEDLLGVDVMNARTQNPELDDFYPTENLMPEGHSVGVSQETPDNLLS